MSLRSRARLATVLFGALSACARTQVVTTPDPRAAPVSSCTVATLGLPAGSSGPLRPAVSGHPSGRFAVAWLELGDTERLVVAALDEDAHLLGDPIAVAPGWTGLASPRLGATEAGFVIAFYGLAPDGREGIAMVPLDLDGSAGEPALLLDVRAARPLAIVERDGALLVGWNDLELADARLHLTLVQLGAASFPDADLGPAALDPALELLTDAGGVRATWVGADGLFQDPTESIKVRAFDDLLRAAPDEVRLGRGRGPSIAPRRGDVDDILVLYTRRPDELLSLVALSGRGAVPLDLPVEGRLGAIARAPGNDPRAPAVACIARPLMSADGDEIRCVELDDAGRPRPTTETGVAGGANGLAGLELAEGRRATAIVWQQLDDRTGSAIAFATYRCAR